MTDLVSRVRDADPTANLTLDPATSQRMDAALERLLIAEPAAGRPRRAVSRWTLMLAAATAALATVVALAALPSGGGRSPIAPAPANAAEALLQLGATAARGATPDGAYLYLRRLSYTSYMRPRPSGHGFFPTVVPVQIEIWFARDGSERLERIHEAWDDATYPTARDRADAEASGPYPRNPEEGLVIRYTDTRVAGFTVAELQALPTDPSALRARLEAAKLGFKSPSPLVTVTGLVLGSPLTPPDVRAAAFAVLRGLPNATLVRGAADPRGRTGSAIEFDEGGWRTLYIFDTESSALIATQSIGKRELPHRRIRDWILQLETRGTRSAPPVTGTAAIEVGP